MTGFVVGVLLCGTWMVAGVRGDYPCCSHTPLAAEDTTYISPNKVYSYSSFPFLCRMMQKDQFAGTCVILTDKVVLACCAFLKNEKDITIVVDRSLTDKRTARAKAIAFPHTKKGTCKFCVIHLASSLNPEGCHPDDRVCGVCLPDTYFHTTGPVVAAFYTTTEGCPSLFSTTCFSVRKFHVDCCSHIQSQCDDPTLLCSSDMCSFTNSFQCVGLMGAPVVAVVNETFYLLSIFCNYVDCMNLDGCTTMHNLPYYDGFLRSNMK